MKRIWSIILACGLLISLFAISPAYAGEAGSLTATLQDDTHVRLQEPDAIEGVSRVNEICVRYDPNGERTRIAYLKFEIKGLADFEKIDKCTLNLTINPAVRKGDVSFAVVPVTGAWDSKTTTWKNQPKIDTKTVVGKFDGSKALSANTKVITVDLKASYFTKDGVYNLALAPIAGGLDLNDHSFSSMETGNGPQIVFEGIKKAGATTPPPATNGIKVKLNGNYLTFDQAPIAESGRTLVPLRAIFEAFGATVNWDQATQSVTAVKGDITIKLTLGSKTAYKNDTPITLDVPAKALNGRTLVPVRFISESFGATVEWDQANQTVIITYNG
jgi:hypothetical protein